MGGYAGLPDVGAGPRLPKGSLPGWEERAARRALTGRRAARAAAELPAFISSGSNEPRSALEARRVSLGWESWPAG